MNNSIIGYYDSSHMTTEVQTPTYMHSDLFDTILNTVQKMDVELELETECVAESIQNHSCSLSQAEVRLHECVASYVLVELWLVELLFPLFR